MIMDSLSSHSETHGRLRNVEVVTVVPSNPQLAPCQFHPVPQKHRHNDLYKSSEGWLWISAYTSKQSGTVSTWKWKHPHVLKLASWSLFPSSFSPCVLVEWELQLVCSASIVVVVLWEHAQPLAVRLAVSQTHLPCKRALFENGYSLFRDAFYLHCPCSRSLSVSIPLFVVL